MRPVLILIAVCMSVLGSLAHAQERVVVVELFTSQGCSSCPPADALLRDLAGRDDVLPLALHVDYWDYLGWRDRFAQAGFSKRQKGYARAAGRRTVYTPEILVQGTHAIMGAKAMKLADLIRAHASQPAPVDLRIARQGGDVTILAEARGADVPPAQVHLVRYVPEQTVSIDRGENAGRNVTYTHIATDWRVVGDWNGQDTWQARVAVPSDLPLLVLVQSQNYGPILAAARLR